MLPAYKEVRAAAFFFGIFLMLANWFLLNLVLAVVCKAHSESAVKAGSRCQQHELSAVVRGWRTTTIKPHKTAAAPLGQMAKMVVGEKLRKMMRTCRRLFLLFCSNFRCVWMCLVESSLVIYPPHLTHKKGNNHLSGLFSARTTPNKPPELLRP